MTSPLEDFEVLQLLGTNSCSSCYKVCNINSNEIFVWKVLHIGNLSGKQKQLLKKEAADVRDINHNNIIQFVDEIISPEENKLYIITEFCSEGSVASLIKSCKRSSTFINECWIWQVLYEVCGALKACQSWSESASFLHLKVKPTSVFLDLSGSVKLGNIDLLKPVDSNHNDVMDCTDAFYFSPELLQKETYSIKSDMWSLGCLIYELCALAPPFSSHTFSELQNKVELGRYERIPSHFSDDLSLVIANLLTRDPLLRPSPSDLMTNSVVLAHVVESVTLDEYPPPTNDCFVESPRQKQKAFGKAPAASPAEPEQVSKDTFRTEWLVRLEAVRQREANVRDREAAVQERERLVSRREHKVALLEKAVKDKMTRAELYLKRSRESKSSQRKPPLNTAIDESFSADPGDSSVLPTMTLLNLAQVPRPVGFTGPDRRVHWLGPDVPKKIEEEIVLPKNKKVLKLPGYTGPPLIVDAPASDNASSCASSGSSLQNPHSPTVAPPEMELKVLFDDRPMVVEDHMRRVSTMASQLEALNLEMARIKNNVPQTFVRPQPPKRIDSLGLETKHIDFTRFCPQKESDFYRGDLRQSVKALKSVSSRSSGSLHLNGHFQEGHIRIPGSGHQCPKSHRSSTPLTCSSTGSSRPSSVDLKDVGEQNAKNSIISSIGPKQKAANKMLIMSSNGKENPSRPAKKSVLSFKTASSIYSRNKKPLKAEHNQIR